MLGGEGLEREELRENVKAARKSFIILRQAPRVNTWLPNNSHFPSLSTDTPKPPFMYWILTFLCQLNVKENSVYSCEGSAASSVIQYAESKES